MAVAKNPGVGRGQGGGRPKREGPVELVQLRLTPEAAATLRALAQAKGTPAWQLVDRMIREGAPSAEKAPPHFPEGLQIAEEINGFLEGQENRPAALPEMAKRMLVVDARRLLLLAGKDPSCTVWDSGTRVYGPVAALAEAIRYVATGDPVESNWTMSETQSLGRWLKEYTPLWEEWSTLYPAILETGGTADLQRGERLFVLMEELESDWLASAWVPRERSPEV